MGTSDDGSAIQKGLVPSRACVVPAGEAQGFVLDDMIATRSFDVAISAQYDSIPVKTCCN